MNIDGARSGKINAAKSDEGPSAAMGRRLLLWESQRRRSNRRRDRSDRLRPDQRL
jgi:hypothetical protein